MSIFLRRDSEARELRAGLGGHSFLPRIDNVLYFVKDCVSSELRHFQTRLCFVLKMGGGMYVCNL